MPSHPDQAQTILKLVGMRTFLSYIRHEDFRPSSVLRPSVCNAQGTPLDSETGWTGDLWSNPVLLILEN